jgi:regulator of protease activity HflC (stomatin/prohibitin superfamily)
MIGKTIFILMEFPIQIRKIPPLRVALGISFLFLALRSFVIVPVGSVGITTLMGNPSQQPLNPGIYLRNPFSRLVLFSARTTELKEKISSPSKEGLLMSIEISILYRVDPSKARDIYSTIGPDFKDIVLIPTFRSLVRAKSARFDAISLYTLYRQRLAQEITDSLRASLAPRGIIVESTPLRDVLPPANVMAAIQSKIQAQQENERMKYVLLKEKQESDRKRIAAQGTADAQRIVSASLTNQIIQYRNVEAIEKLADSPNSKIVIMGSSSRSAPFVLQP